MQCNPEVFCIGAVSLALLFGLPMLPEKAKKVLPAPMIVLILGIALGYVFDLEHEQPSSKNAFTSRPWGHQYFFGDFRLSNACGRID
jgi:MFS superfamily sulfate permease-like transporter